jgi:excisionase family DNA binding protein
MELKRGRFEDLPLTLTVEEASAVLRTGRSATYEAVRTGKIPSVRIGRKIRIPRAGLARLLGESVSKDASH